MSMIVAPQMVPSLRQGYTNSGGSEAQLEIGKRLSGIDVNMPAKAQTSQEYTARKISMGADPDAVLASTKGGGSSSGAGEAKTGQGRAAEMIARGVDPAIVIAADKQIAAEQTKQEHGAYRKAQIRKAAMLTHNQAEQGYANANQIHQENIMRSVEKTLDMRIGV